jgi:hypothetical protein
MSALLRELEEAGLWVFGGREERRLEGGGGPASAFPVAILRVTRGASPEIIAVDFRDHTGAKCEHPGKDTTRVNK